MYYSVYKYKGAYVVGYFYDSKGEIKVFTTKCILENYLKNASKEWIEENLKCYSRKELKNYIENHSDSHLSWEDIKRKYFDKQEKQEEMNKIEVAETLDSSKHISDENRYYWPLGEIELEEAQL